jgi:hypothetical protein
VTGRNARSDDKSLVEFEEVGKRRILKVRIDGVLKETHRIPTKTSPISSNLLNSFEFPIANLHCNHPENVKLRHSLSHAPSH